VILLLPVIDRIISQPFKSLKLLTKSPFRFLEISVWPLTYLFLFIFIIQSFGVDPELIRLILMAMLGWQAVHHAQMGIGTTYMDEYWSHSLTHLFISPIHLTEMVIGGIITGVVKMGVVLLLFLAAIFLVYGITIVNWPFFLIAVFFLFVFGISIGMLNLSAMFLYRENAISLVWTIADIFVVLSGVYYSISILPAPLQFVSKILPATYAFDILKSLGKNAAIDWIPLIVLSLVWLVGSYVIIAWAFSKAKKKGTLVRVM
jgi:ABC-2 type transport system permease protein